MKKTNAVRGVVSHFQVRERSGEKNNHGVVGLGRAGLCMQNGTAIRSKLVQVRGGGVVWSLKRPQAVRLRII